MTTNTTAQRINDARMRLTMSHPWWSSLLLSLEPVEVPPEHFTSNGLQPTAATNGVTIKYVAEFIATLSNHELDALLTHEALHCGLLHHLRIGQRDHGKWNHATDYAVNLILDEDGFTLPEGGLLDRQYAGLSAEEIYNLLPEGDYNAPRFGSVVQGGREGAKGRQAAEWSSAMNKALHTAIKAGRLPGRADRLLDEINSPPEVPWLDLLARFIERATGRDDYTWRRPSRRGLAIGCVLPSMEGSQCKPIAICIDTSASMSDDELKQAVRSIQDCVETVRPTTIYVISADVEVTNVVELDQTDDYLTKSSLKGGGGTNFIPAIEKAMDFDPCCIVYFTDLYGNFGHDPGIPVVWITETDSYPTPYGETIVIKEGGH